MSTLANQLAAAEREEVARAIRLLLAHPLLTDTVDPAGFELVRRRREPLAQWFDYTCGWSLVVEPRRGYARLGKVRADPDASRPARRVRSGRAPFDRRRYVLLCVTAAELLSLPMTTIGMLADRVVQATAADRALAAFDPVHRSERMAFVDVLKLLESYDVLRAVDGTTETYVESAEAKVLYRVDTTLLMRLPAAPVGASRLAVPPEEVPARFGELLTALVRERRYGGTNTALDATADGTHGERTATDAQRNLRLRHSVLRRLFDDPVLYRADLGEDELAYVTSLTGRQILRRSVEQAGFLLEERAEGFLLVDPDGIATDVRFPDDTSTARVAALLLLEPLCAAPAGLLPEQLAEAGTGLLRRFPRWAKAYQSDDGPLRLSADAVRVLRDVGLVRTVEGRVVACPAAYRYRLTEMKSREPDAGPQRERDGRPPDTAGEAAAGADVLEGDQR
ncbi:TIGR02678 family protein [Streptomyces mangrovisoli]|uniref:TIGR02678 family protein n=1 Tax=Streptomyces mangrovisoli TaxID=1428628 RepID=A0A1J4NVC0_9ACTN|nr:TIGR02678 family protein [Streptomyces mangrovisoli]OIJ66026.1 TIGR02678 family protein [Streptomyces mangrovisoli]